MPRTNAQEEGARAKKKRVTRIALHRAALELLCADHGEVTVDDIAARAGVSSRTFFNYFPTKESVFTGADPELPNRLAAALIARPATESIAQAVGAVIAERLRALFSDAELWELRREAALRYPTLAASMMGVNALAEHAVAMAACQRAGVEVRDDLRPAAEAFAVLGAARASMLQHMENDLEGSLDQRISDALAPLAGL